mmetsp:Transcript_20820/g.48888  ORF Transcript_20820/g.48888 Transcript_20820/m.48888 type:complete len:201 (+) Transcript_20820:165-767(+)
MPETPTSLSSSLMQLESQSWPSISLNSALPAAVLSCDVCDSTSWMTPLFSSSSSPVRLRLPLLLLSFFPFILAASSSSSLLILRRTRLLVYVTKAARHTMMVTNVAMRNEVRFLVAAYATFPEGGPLPSAKPPEAGVSPASDTTTWELSGTAAVRTTAGLAVGCSVVGLAVGSAVGLPVTAGSCMASSIALSTPRQSRDR